MTIGSPVVLPVSLPRLSPPRHERLVRFFGLRLRLVAAIVVAAVVAGGFATAYLALLERASDELGPDRFGDVAQIVVLVITGVLVAIGVHVLGHPADVELLVDNIHVPETGDAHPARLRSLLPVSLACIAVGGTLGPEAPVVTTSGTLAHRGATTAGLTADDIRIVTLTGMAAGFAVLFGAPLGGAVFALEIPHRRGMQYHEALVPAAIGAAIGFVITGVAHGFGVHPVWTYVPGPDPTATDLGWSVLAGAVGAAIAVVFTVAVRTLLAIARRIPPAVRPAVGGLVLGALAVASPFALTNGEFQFDQLVGDRTLRFLVIAAAVKLAAAAVAVASGWRGGFIIPLFVVGFAVGLAMAPHLPGATPWVFAVGVMAAANVGVTKTPIGSTLVVSEMTASMVLAPTLIASLTALVATSEIGLIHSQRERVDAYGERHGAPD